MTPPQEGLNPKRLKDVLSLAVRGEPFDALLNSLLLAARELAGTDLAASIYMADDSGAVLDMAASAGLEPEVARALTRLPVGEHEAACGRAAFLREVVVVPDVFAEPRMQPYLGLARAFGIRACWSWPLHAPDGGIMGTLAFYHRQVCVPDRAQQADIGYVADMAALLIERELRERRNRDRLAVVGADAERRRRLYEAVLDNTPDLNYVFDLEHRFTYANEVLLQMWGRSWDEAIGKNCLELGYPDWHAAMHGREIEQVKATRAPIRGEVPFDGAFGLRIYEYIFMPVLGPDGEVEAVAGTTRDVTERKRGEEELQLANRRKDEFLAMLAHELRNPLAPISAAAQVLRLAPGDPSRVRNYADVIARQVGHMTSLVNDLLDVSRVTRGMVQFERAPVDLRSVLASAAEQVQPLIEARQHTLVIDTGAAQPAAVEGDRARLIQVVANLLANAAKYTAPGGRILLKLDTDADADGGDGGAVRIAVGDNGSGIEPALLPHVFELFTQSERTPDRAQGGLGLGLALVRTIVLAHGGRVRADSAGLGQGSTFTVELPPAPAREGTPTPAPAARPAAPASGAAARGARQPLRIVLVDDNLDAATTLASLLEAAGHRVTVLQEPAAALTAAPPLAPHAFILDIGLPGMDGYTLARRLRALPACARALYIALTGYGQPNDRLLSREAGFEHHLVKPADVARLLELLEAHAPLTAG